MERLAQAIWDPWLLGLFLLVGTIYSFGSGFFQFFQAKVWLRATVGSLFSRPSGKHRSGALTSVQALATALASTMGTGSIAGVAAALCLGGPGAVFWMWVSALLGMMTSCGEKLLSVKWQRPAPGGGLQGGPMFYLRDALGCPVLARWFALAWIPAALIGGNLVVTLDSIGTACIEQCRCSHYVCADKALRIDNGTVNMALSREVYNDIRFLFLEEVEYEFAVCDITLYELVVWLVLDRF